MGCDVCQPRKGSPGLVCTFSGKRWTLLGCEFGEIVSLRLAHQNSFIITVVTCKDKIYSHRAVNTFHLNGVLQFLKLACTLMHPRKMQQVMETFFNSKIRVLIIVWNRIMCILQNNKNNGIAKRQTVLEYASPECFRLYLFIQSSSEGYYTLACDYWSHR